MTDHPTDLKALAQNYLADAQMFQKDAQDAQRQLREFREQSAEFLERLTKAAHEKADEQNWCSEFDEFMESFGLEGRSKEYRVTVMTTVFHTEIVTARDEEAAEELAQDIAENEWGNWGLDVSDVEMVEIEEV